MIRLLMIGYVLKGLTPFSVSPALTKRMFRIQIKHLRKKKIQIKQRNAGAEARSKRVRETS